MTELCFGHCVRLRDFDDAELNGKLARISWTSLSGTKGIDLLDDSVRPPVPLSPNCFKMVLPHQLQHACEHCLVASAKLMTCGKCKTSRYCNAECQRADWARHKVKDCGEFADVRMKRYLGKPLQVACALGEFEEVRRQVEEVGKDVDEGTSSDCTPLCAAAQCGELTIVRYLVERGANMNKAIANGSTPLFMAVQEGHMAVVRYLVQRGADKNTAAKDGRTPLRIARERGHAAIVVYLSAAGCK